MKLSHFGIKKIFWKSTFNAVNVFSQQRFSKTVYLWGSKLSDFSLSDETSAESIARCITKDSGNNAHILLYQPGWCKTGIVLFESRVSQIQMACKFYLSVYFISLEIISISIAVIIVVSL